MQDPSASQRRQRLGCRVGTFIRIVAFARLPAILALPTLSGLSGDEESNLFFDDRGIGLDHVRNLVPAIGQ
jgi:hypothetical protein